ncbi:MAG TPA: hypothetical protein VEA69_21220 [Tepidisphaeraceae bacterium]|nr:hypothetical protein [Tepidisphaeraceae bacterium]
MTTADYMLYVAAEALNPRGEQRDDLRMGILAAAVSNPYRGKNSRPFKPADFIPKFGARRQDPRRLKAEFKAYTLALGGTVTEARHVN